MELEDLQVFLPEEQAREALDAFDCDADGHISSDDMKEAVLQVQTLPCIFLGCHGLTAQYSESRDTCCACNRAFVHADQHSAILSSVLMSIECCADI